MIPTLFMNGIHNRKKLNKFTLARHKNVCTRSTKRNIFSDSSVCWPNILSHWPGPAGNPYG